MRNSLRLNGPRETFFAAAMIQHQPKGGKIQPPQRGIFTQPLTTKPGFLLKSHIPIKTNQWDETRPGFIEADTVAHCGTSLSGEFALTLDTVDIATGWTEQRAVWGKGESQDPLLLLPVTMIMSQRVWCWVTF